MSTWLIVVLLVGAFVLVVHLCALLLVAVGKNDDLETENLYLRMKDEPPISVGCIGMNNRDVP